MAATGDTLDLLEFDETTGKRAVYESFEFEHRGGGEVLVRNASHGDEDGHEYTVYVAGDIPIDCTCPAFEYHCGPGEACKHCVAVALHWHEIQADRDAPAIRADGGQQVDPESDDRPADCDCGEWTDPSGLPCWPCYRDGFETPNPHAQGVDAIGATNTGP